MEYRDRAIIRYRFFDICDKHFPDSVWAGVADVSQWELGTPEVFELFNLAIIQLKDKNLLCQAFVQGSTVTQGVVDKYSEHANRKEPLPTFYTEDLSTAINWLRSNLKENEKQQGK